MWKTIAVVLYCVVVSSWDVPSRITTVFKRILYHLIHDHHIIITSNITCFRTMYTLFLYFHFRLCKRKMLWKDHRVCILNLKSAVTRLEVQVELCNGQFNVFLAVLVYFTRSNWNPTSITAQSSEACRGFDASAYLQSQRLRKLNEFSLSHSYASK